MAELTTRQQAVLKLIVGEYIRSAAPVSSQALLGDYHLNVSSATIRNDMAYLEELGYISHPHTSAGRIPSDKGYRYFVEWLMDDADLPEQDKSSIRHRFALSESDVAEWSQLAAGILASTVKTASVATLPTAPQCRLKHMDLIPVQEVVALLVVVLAEGVVRQQMLNLPEVVTEDDLGHISHTLTALFRGRNADQISRHAGALSPTETVVKETVVRLMGQLDTQRYHKVYLDGIVAMLSQPEFARADKTRHMLELLHSEGLASMVLPEIGAGETMKVTIGGENAAADFRECTVILGRYGVNGEMTGVVGVLGPTRLPYDRAISAVRYTCLVMTDLMREYFPRS